MASPQQAVHRGIVKQVLSGDSIVVRGQPRGGPPPERTIGLSNVTAPRLARRPNPSLEGSETKDEPFAWESREYLRKKLIGKEVAFTVEYKVPGTGKEYCYIYNGKDTESENVAEAIVAEGLVELRRGGLKPNDEGQQSLVQLEEAAKAGGKGKWAPESEHAAHVREVKWNIENLRHFVDSHHGKPIDAVIEHVRDGCTVRAFLLPSFHYVTVMLSGIKCPMFRLEGEAEPFAEQAKFFTESRLLNRDIQIIMEGVSNQNILGSVIHPKGNIAELLLKEGFARCVDWSMGVVSQGTEKLRAAERVGKEKRLRIWKDYTPSTAATDVKDNYSGKVVEVVNGDALMVKTANGTSKKIFLSSIRSPRPSADADDSKKKDPRYRPRPLYDIPFMFEAREFLRKKLIGKKVNIAVDYIQPKSDDFPEKTCCTVTINNINIAEALVTRGYASVVRYRQDDDKRSSHYDELLAAEARASKKGVGIHNKKDSSLIKVADVSGDVNKSKQFLPFLQRAGRCEAIVEFVASGSRLRLYIPRETCLVTFLLSGLSCPRGPRQAPDRSGNIIPGEEFGEEAMLFTKDLVLQKEVEVEVESMDKGGNFIGWLFFENTNLSVALVEEGLSKVHFTAERSSFYGKLCQAEEKAKSTKLKIWSKYEEPTEVVPENEPQERKENYKTVCITEITDELHFYAQNVETGPQLEKLMEQLREDLNANPPLTGSYVPRKGDMCAAKFSDGEWYRAKVVKVTGHNVHLFYLDYGNKELSDSTKLGTLPATYQTLPPQAQEYTFACVSLPPDEDDVHLAVDTLFAEILNKECLLNTEYKNGALECVSLLYADSKEDVAQSLISEGMLLVESRREKRLAKLVGNYLKAQDKAKNARLNLWRYGDFTADDAKEFGYQR